MRRVFDRFLVIFVAQIPGNVTARIAHFTGRCGAAHWPFVADTQIATPRLSSAQLSSAMLELNLSIVVHLLIFCGTFVPSVSRLCGGGAGCIDALLRQINSLQRI